ncbi:MAG: IclR family transcriptional regulator [Bryobacterales bacterium]|nr:IclR family transcriptional regulator [Bryobacterales bacterium]
MSLAKGFRVLEVFQAQQPEMTISEIAGRAGLDAGTAFRLVKTLVMLGYLRQVPDSKRYALDWKVLDLGFNAIGHSDIHAVARPILRSLVGKVNEAASLAVLDGPDAVYVERVQFGLGRLGITQRIGSRVPVYSSAVGHAILAYYPLEERLRILNQRERVKLTPNTPVSIAEIEKRLQTVREKGYALSDQDTVLGVRVLAAPILDLDEHPWGAISVAAPSFSCSLDEFIGHSRTALIEAAKVLGKVLRVSGSAAMG